MRHSVRPILGLLITLPLVIAGAPAASAADAWWHGVLGTEWDGDESWFDAPPPNGNEVPAPDGAAIFEDGAQTGFVDVTAVTLVETMSFRASSLDYLVTVDLGARLDVKNGGLEKIGAADAKIVVAKNARFSLSGTSRTKGARITVETEGIVTLEDRTVVHTNASGAGALAVIVKPGGVFDAGDRIKAGSLKVEVQEGALATIRDQADTRDADFLVQLRGDMSVSGALGPKRNGRVPVRRIESFGTLDVGSNRLEVRRDFTSARVLDLSFFRSKPGFVRVGKDARLGGTLVVRGRRAVPPGRYILIKAFGSLSGTFSRLKLVGFGPGRTGKLEYNAPTRSVILVLD